LVIGLLCPFAYKYVVTVLFSVTLNPVLTKIPFEVGLREKGFINGEI
jgi:hypothetical protein